jgi:hypothetical protein
MGSICPSTQLHLGQGRNLFSAHLLLVQGVDAQISLPAKSHVRLLRPFVLPSQPGQASWLLVDIQAPGEHLSPSPSQLPLLMALGEGTRHSSFTGPMPIVLMSMGMHECSPAGVL